MTSENPSIARSVREALDAVKIAPEDSGGAALALLYAQRIDEDNDLLADLGPKLLACLTALGMTPSGRGVKPKAGGESNGPADALAALRAARGAGSRAGKGLHPAAG